MSAGASAGLQARGQDLASSAAADRLSLAYNQLAAEEAARSDAAQQRLQLANTENMLKERQINMMDQWHQAQVAQQAASAAGLDKYRTAELGQRGDAADALAQYRTDTLQLGRDKLNKPALHFGTQGEVLKEDPETGEITQARPPRASSVRPSPFDMQSHASLLSEENALQKALTTGGALMDDATRLKSLNRIGQIRKLRTALEGKYAQPNAAQAISGAMPAPGAGTIPPKASRVKVKGPGGVSGTIPQSSTLPDGWSLIQEAEQGGASPDTTPDEEEE